MTASSERDKLRRNAERPHERFIVLWRPTTEANSSPFRPVAGCWAKRLLTTGEFHAIWPTVLIGVAQILKR